jgi:hypothetical protein
MEKRNLKTIEIIRPVFLEKGIGLSEAERIKTNHHKTRKYLIVFLRCALGHKIDRNMGE